MSSVLRRIFGLGVISVFICLLTIAVALLPASGQVLAAPRASSSYGSLAYSKSLQNAFDGYGAVSASGTSPIKITHTSVPTSENAYTKNITVRASVSIDTSTEVLTLQRAPQCAADVEYGHGKAGIITCVPDESAGYDPVNHSAVGVLYFKVEYGVALPAGFAWPSCKAQIGYSSKGTTVAEDPICETLSGPPPGFLPECHLKYIIFGPPDCSNQDWYKSVIQDLNSNNYMNVRAAIASLFAPYPSTRAGILDFMRNFGDGNPGLSCVQDHARDFAFRIAQSRAAIKDLQTVLEVARKIFLKQIPSGDFADKIKMLLDDYYKELSQKLLDKVYDAGINTQAHNFLTTMYDCLTQ